MEIKTVFLRKHTHIINYNIEYHDKHESYIDSIKIIVYTVSFILI